MLEKREVGRIISKSFVNIVTQLNNHINNRKEIEEFLHKVEIDLNAKIKLK